MEQPATTPCVIHKVGNQNMSKKLIIIALLGVGSALLSGCSSSGNGYEANPAGTEANSGKKYTADDAAAAQPKRQGSESAGN